MSHFSVGVVITSKQLHEFLEGELTEKQIKEQIDTGTENMDSEVMEAVSAVIEEKLSPYAADADAEYMDFHVDMTAKEILEYAETMREELRPPYMQIKRTYENKFFDKVSAAYKNQFFMEVHNFLDEVSADPACIRNVEKFCRLMEAETEDEIHDAYCELCEFETNEFGDSGYYANPDAKWDYWTIGCNTRNAVKKKQKDGTVIPAFIACIRDIDWGINKEEYDAASALWDYAVDGKPWKYEDEKSPVLFYKKEYYLNRYKTKETFAKTVAREHPFAFVDAEGEWYARGMMMSFGQSSDTGEEEIAWSEQFYDSFIKNLSRDDIYVVLDCHV